MASPKIVVSAFMIASAAAAQPVPPRFEVASVRINKNPYIRSSLDPDAPPAPPPPPSIRTSPNSLTMTQINLGSCIMWAWDLDSHSVSAPSGTAYDISAKASSPVPVSQLKLMLRMLLVERFHLKTHMEKQDREFTVLLVAKGGPKLHQSSPGEGFERKVVSVPGGGQRMDFRNAPVSLLSGFINDMPALGPAMDGTGLRGGYNFSFIMPRLGRGSPEQWYSAWKDALEKQLGLTLGVKRGSLDRMVVDYADEVPAPN